MIIETANPINPGFYYTEIDPMTNGLEDQYLTNEEKIGTVEYDYKEYRKEVSSKINDLFIQEINNIISENLDIKDAFTKIKEELISPREYNYGTDRSFATLEVEEKNYKKIINWIFSECKDSLIEHIIENHKSYSGFISFYSIHLSEWKNRYDFDCNELETILETIFDLYSTRDLDEEFERISGEVFDNMELTVKEEG